MVLLICNMALFGGVAVSADAAGNGQLPSKEFKATTVTLPDGGSVLCLELTADKGGLSCDWENIR